MALTTLTTGATTAPGLSETGWPGVPCTVVAQLPSTIGVAAAAVPGEVARPPMPAAKTSASAPANPPMRRRMYSSLRGTGQ